MVLLLVSTSFIGISNEVEEIVVEQQAISTSGSPPMDSPWPMKCHDLHHTSRSPFSTVNITGLEKWRFRSEKDGGMESSAVIDNNGIIYFGTMGSDHKLYALYPNGTKKWSYKVGSLIWSTPAIAEDGTIYVTSWDDYLYAVHSNGTLKWRNKLGGDSSCSPAIGDDGTIYCGSTSSFIYAINPNGTLKWRYLTGDWTMSNPAIGSDGTIYIGSYDNYLYALYPNGTLRWRFGTGGDIKGHPSIADDGTIYIPSRSGYLYALYQNGTMKWKVSTGNSIIAASAAIASDGTIYVGTEKLRAFYPNGTLKWSVDVGGDIYGTSPAISVDGIIYVSAGKNLVAINPDGTEKWRKELCNLHGRSSPCIGEDGTIYVGSSWNDDHGNKFGYLHAFGELDPNAPFAPDIDGETSGKIEEEYKYTFTTTDPNGDDVYYWIEWGDGKIKNWIGPYDSGEEITINHTYEEKDTYIIKARAKDTNNLWGPWSEFEVTMPKTKQSTNRWFIQFLEKHPRMFPILRQLLGL